MASSGTFTFQLTNTSIILDAFERIPGIEPEMLTVRHFISARNSINLIFLDWANQGILFWKVISGTIALTVGQPVYTLPSNLVTLTDVWYSQVNADGAGVNQDRILVPMSRDEYAELPNKNQQGVPTRYWFQMLVQPQITIWEVPQTGQAAPTCVINWFGLQQIQDANAFGAETPDIHSRAIKALISDLTLDLTEKFGPKDPQARQQLMAEKKAIRDEAWANFTRRDQEPGTIWMRLDVSSYGRLH